MCGMCSAAMMAVSVTRQVQGCAHAVRLRVGPAL
jgi:hypothetical protein